MTISDYTQLPNSLQPMAYRADAQASVKEVATRQMLRQNAPFFAQLCCLSLDRAIKQLQGVFLPFQVGGPAILYCKGSTWTIFDFATDSPNWADRYRKLYNAILCFWQQLGLNPLRMRQSIDYVFVSMNISKKHRPNGVQGGSRLYLHARYANVASRPWEYVTGNVRRSSKVFHDLRKMSDYLVRKAYFVFPSELDAYARINGWSNV